MKHGGIALLLALALGSDPGFALGSDPVFVAQAASKAPPKTAPHVVTIDSFAFKPPVVTVKRGETIEWRNDDPVPHTATSKAAGLDSGSIAPGATYRFVAKKKGRFDYLCTFHPIMKGEIVVK
jgi:plastocyanin